LAYTPIDPRQFAGSISSWMRTDATDSDVVVSCRVRLARNLRGFPFAARLDGERAREVADLLRPILLDARFDGETIWVAMDQAPLVLRLLLRERHLISRDLAPCDEPLAVPPGRAVAFGRTERLSVMVNEEDHLRIQSVAPGFELDQAWAQAEGLDLFLEQRLPFAYTEELGYLTGCPTNVGTGLRASVMLHLPALGLVRTELDKVFTAAGRTGLAVRGLYGEGSRAVGDFYQVSNQVTLGCSESGLVDDLRALVPVITAFERRVRRALLEDQRSALRDRIGRSLSTLRMSPSLATELALSHLSNVRLGHYLGLLDGTPMEVLKELGVQVQKGHIHALNAPGEDDGLLGEAERDALRARLIRQRLTSNN